MSETFLPSCFFIFFFKKLLKSRCFDPSLFFGIVFEPVNKRRDGTRRGNAGNRLVVADFPFTFARVRVRWMKFQFGTVAIAHDSANSVTIFLDYQPVRPRHKVSGTRCSTGETTYVRYGLIGRAREFSVTS